jgi:hypothetical protein
MKPINKFFIGIFFILPIFLLSCTNEQENKEETDFCSYLSLQEIDATIPLVNEYLNSLPNDLSKEQIFENLVVWFNSFPCEVNAQILYGYDFPTNQELMYGVSFKIQDGEIERELELDFSLVNNMMTYRHIDGYHYFKEDKIYVKTQFSDINSVFQFNNSIGLDVFEIQYGTYLSSLPANNVTLQNMINDIKLKSYTNENWVNGHLNWYNANMVLFVRLYEMHNMNYQQDWLQTMNTYNLTNYSAIKHIVVFKIAENSYEQWEADFSSNEFVEWTEKGYSRYEIRPN